MRSVRYPSTVSRSSKRLAVYAVAIATALALASPEVRAGNWPTPSLGPSESGDPEVLFTFDDGPDEKHTAAILDILAARQITAIFFWVGRRIKPGRNVEGRRAVVARAIRDGHVIANHTVNHVHLCSVDKNEAAREIDDNEAMFASLTQMPVRLFRAPYGNKCKRLEAQLAERGLVHFHWDIDPQEWQNHDSELTSKTVIRKLSALQGRAVILMHDTHNVAVRALPKILDWIDKENAKRAAKGKNPIRILDAATVGAERLSPGINRFLQVARDESESAVTRVIATITPG